MQRGFNAASITPVQHPVPLGQTGQVVDSAATSKVAVILNRGSSSIRFVASHDIAMRGPTLRLPRGSSGFACRRFACPVFHRTLVPKTALICSGGVPHAGHAACDSQYRTLGSVPNVGISTERWDLCPIGFPTHRRKQRLPSSTQG